MPTCLVTNETNLPLNVALKHITALHFENVLSPGDTAKFRTGRVWFSLEARVDEGEGSASRYSVKKSAATIALISLAVGGVAVTAGAALLPEAAVVVGGATAAAIAKGVTFTKSTLLTKSAMGTITKVSGLVLPKVVDKVTAEAGGLSALQKEVLSIVSSPTLSSDVRRKSAALLRSLHTAYAADKEKSRAGKGAEAVKAGGEGGATIRELSKEEEEALRELEEFEMSERGEGQGVEGPGETGQPPGDAARREKAEPSASPATTPGTTAPTPPSSLLDRGKTLFQRRRSAADAAADATSPPGHSTTHADVAHGEPAPVQTARTLRVHGVYMQGRREFSVRTGKDGRMELWDKAKGEVVR